MKKRLAALAVPLALALLLSGCGLFGWNNVMETPPSPTVSETPQPVSTYPSVYETATPQPVADARVYPAELTESEMALLDLFGEDADGWSLYDFAVPSGTQYVAVTLWQLEDGAWQRRSSDSASMSVGEGTGRIAVRFDLETLSFEYACQMGSLASRGDDGPKALLQGGGGEGLGGGGGAVGRDDVDLIGNAKAPQPLDAGTHGVQIAV